MPLVFSALTTDELIRHVQMTSEVTPLEMELLGRLVGAMDEIDALAIDLKALEDRRADPGSKG